MLPSAGAGDAEKRKFFRSEGNHVYGAKGESYLSRCRNDSRGKRDDFADVRGRGRDFTEERGGGREFSSILFFFFSFLLSFFRSISSRLVCDIHLPDFVKNTLRAKNLSYAASQISSLICRFFPPHRIFPS